jgi:hypothetical protein
VAFFALTPRLAWIVKSVGTLVRLRRKERWIRASADLLGLDLGLYALYNMRPSSSREENEERAVDCNSICLNVQHFHSLLLYSSEL